MSELQQYLARMVKSAGKRAQAEVDDWCRSESCRYRNWRSGSVPTHRLGADCPTPAASQVQGAAEVGADVEALAVLLESIEIATDEHGDGATLMEGPARRLAAELTSAGWVPPERVAEARAEELRAAAIAARGMHDPIAPDCVEWADWLDARADRIAERGDSS